MLGQVILLKNTLGKRLTRRRKNGTFALLKQAPVGWPRLTVSPYL